MRYLILLLAFFSSVALAQAPVVMNNGMSWDPPREYTDGSAIASGDIDHYTILCGTSSGALDITTTVGGNVTFAGKDLFLNTLGLAFGTEYICGLQVTTANGLTSATSATVNFTLPDQRVPNPTGAPVVD